MVSVFLGSQCYNDISVHNDLGNEMQNSSTGPQRFLMKLHTNIKEPIFKEHERFMIFYVSSVSLAFSGIAIVNVSSASNWLFSARNVQL